MLIFYTMQCYLFTMHVCTFYTDGNVYTYLLYW